MTTLVHDNDELGVQAEGATDVAIRLYAGDAIDIDHAWIISRPRAVLLAELILAEAAAHAKEVENACDG